jgi:hypothetical protein
MHTRLLEHIEPLPDDHLIMHSLGFEQRKEMLIGATYPVGIRNSAGLVYRLVQAQGVGETVRLVRAMQKLGFTEEDHQSATEGCNSTFRRRRNAPH